MSNLTLWLRHWRAPYRHCWAGTHSHRATSIQGGGKPTAGNNPIQRPRALLPPPRHATMALQTACSHR